MPPDQTQPIPPTGVDGLNTALPPVQTPEDQIKKYKQLVATSTTYLKDRFHKRAKRMVGMYELQHYLDDNGETIEMDEDHVKVAFPHADVRQTLAEIYIKDPRPIVKPESRYFNPDGSPAPQEGPGIICGVDAAQNLKTAIEYVVKKSNFKRSTKLSLLEAIPAGLGVVMISSQVGTKIPKFIRIPYDEVRWIHDVRDINDSWLVARKVVQPLEDIKANPLYNANRDKVPAATLDTKKYGKSDILYGVMWDIFDRKNDKHLLIPDNLNVDLYDNKTITEDYNFNIEGSEYACDHPFAFFVNEEFITEAFGMGDTAPLEDQYMEIDRFRTRQVQDVDRSKRKYFAKENFLDTEAQDVIENGEDGSVITVRDDITPQNFAPVPESQIRSDTFAVEDRIKQDMDLIKATGPNGVTKGVGDTADTLGEAQIIDQNTQTRLGEKRDSVTAYYNRLFRLTAQFIQQHWIEADIMLISGDGDKDSDWVQYNPAMSVGEFDFDTDPESVTDNTAVYRKQIGDAMATVVPLIDKQLVPGPPGAPPTPGPSKVESNSAIATLVRRYLETFDTLKKDVDTIVPEELTKPPLPMDPNDQALLDTVNGSDPQELLQTLNTLPPDQSAAIKQRLIALQSGGKPGIPQGNIPAPSQGTPSYSSISASTNKL